jgi:hypothetical protein
MTTDYKHPDYGRFHPLWMKVRDACNGEDAVKSKGETYLPDPSESGASGATARYDRYLARAVYLNATGRTLQGLVGVAFANWPQVVTKHKILLDDADGSGVGIIGQSQGMLSEVLQTGRAGLLADYSSIDEVTAKRLVTVADWERAGIRAFISAYSADSILTWETQGQVLTRVVLLESHTVYENGEAASLPQLRELLLTGGRYVIKLWQKHTSTGAFVLVDTIKTNRSVIPFTFIGATSNDTSPDTPPLLDLANLNLAHFRNSADFEESAFLMGQPMLAISGVTDEWKESTGGVVFGSRTALVLPIGGDAKLLQAAPNTLAKEAMLDKERMMQMLGARLMTPGEAVKTATQSAAETKAAYSVLSLACDNVSHAYTRVLQWLDDANASFAIDTRFNDLTLDANAIRETVAAWQAGIVPQSDAVGLLQRLGVIDQAKTVQQVAEEIERQGPTLNLDEAA